MFDSDLVCFTAPFLQWFQIMQLIYVSSYSLKNCNDVHKLLDFINWPISPT